MTSGNGFSIERNPQPPDGGGGIMKYITNETKINFSPNHGETLELVRLASRPLQDAATLITLMELLGTNHTASDTITAEWFTGLFRGFATENEMMNASMGKENLRKVLAAVSFFPDPDGTFPDRVKYAIRMDSLIVPDPTKMNEGGFWSSRYSGYLNTGFSLLQDAFDHAIIDFRAGRHVSPAMMYAQPFPIPRRTTDSFSQNIGAALPLFMVLAWIYSM